jgi:hypothetical protein
LPIGERSGRDGALRGRLRRRLVARLCAYRFPARFKPRGDVASNRMRHTLTRFTGST